jgi:dCMP deaminase
MNWDTYFLQMAQLVSTKSKDRSTKVGCVIVGPDHEVRTTGYNGFCRGIIDDVDSRHERPDKYLWTEHAERNAIYNAARNGIQLAGCTAYVTLFPCADCSRAMIQSGIRKIVVDQEGYFTKSKMPVESFLCSERMLKETEVEFHYHAS